MAIDPVAWAVGGTQASQ